MPCYHPRKGLKVGDRMIMISYFDVPKYPKDLVYDLRCGKCPGCRLADNKEKAERALLESRCWSENWFVTLTYDQDHLPCKVCEETGEIVNPLMRKDMQDFMKRLRWSWSVDHNHQGVRAFYAGEYGDRFGRPHYHLLLFNTPLFDLVFHSRSATGDIYLESKELSDLWQNGHVLVGELTSASAAYTAAYVQKKIDAKPYPGLVPVFCQGPSRPGLGAPWFDKNLGVLDDDLLYLPDGKTTNVPNYFLERAKNKFGIDIEDLKRRRREIAEILENQRVSLVSVDRFSYLEDLENDYFLKKRSVFLSKTS